MSDLFSLAGSYTATPGSGSPSADPMVNAPIQEQQVLGVQLTSLCYLTNDLEKELPLGCIDGATVVIVKAVGGKIKLRLTSIDGAAQVVPVDTFAAILSASTPFTAITVQRSPGVATTVKFFLGQLAT
jgi:hypothetical protein